MITSVQYYHLCSLFAHLSREGSEFEKDFVIFYHFSFQVFSKQQLTDATIMYVYSPRVISIWHLNDFNSLPFMVQP